MCGLLIVCAVFNRFDPAYEEAARDLGTGGAQTVTRVVVPTLAPALVGVALFGFTLSFDELVHTRRAIGRRKSSGAPPPRRRPRSTPSAA